MICEVISLEDFELPLYTPTLEEKFKNEELFQKTFQRLKRINMFFKCNDLV